MSMVSDFLTRRVGPLAFCLGVVGLLCSTNASSKPGPGFNDSGQNLCYVNEKWTHQCAGSGQDAEFGRDVAHPGTSNGQAGFHFRKICNTGEAAREGNCPAHPPLGEGPNDWGCTLDVVTGLMWELKTHDGGPRDMALRYTRHGNSRPSPADLYIESVNSVKLCGHQDWRLPGMRELQSIVNYGIVEDRWPGGGLAPMIDQHWFPNSVTGQNEDNRFWTADRITSQCIAIDFRTGEALEQWYYSEFHVRAVRQDSAGNAAHARFVPDGDEVMDRLTGLIWSRCSEGQAWDGATCKGQALRFEWDEGLKRARHVGKQGTGWRMPNVKELASLAVIGKERPAIDTDVFPNTWGGYYLSSTPVPFEIDWKWHVSFHAGMAGTSFKYISGALRLVREVP